MAGAMVSAFTGVMSPALAKLSTLLADEYKLQKGVKEEITFLSDELRSMNTLLLKLADMEEYLDVQLKEWRKNVREISYDIEDCIDVFMHQLGRGDTRASSLVRKIANKIEQFWACHQIPSQIQKLKTRVMEASDRRLRYEVDKFIPNERHEEMDPRLPALYVEADRLVGIDGPREKIIGLLNVEHDSEIQHLKVVSIVGFAGLGKTTLANQVYQKIKTRFDCTTFVPVSRKPNMKKILIDMLKELGSSGDISNDERQLIDKLREHLKNKRYLLVVDDNWSIQAWEQMKPAFPENRFCSRIITTTRIADIAKICCSGFHDHIYNIQPLSDHDSQELFFTRVFHSSYCPPHFKEVSHAIIKKCGGLPLIIISITGLLACKSDSKEQWEQVQYSIRSTLGENPNLQEVKNILLLSYYDLPHHLKTCLLYLSIYPEDSIISRKKLICRWIAEGFVTEERGQTLEQVGQTYFYELINRGMIQPYQIQYDSTAYGCRVHDMVFELILV